MAQKTVYFKNNNHIKIYDVLVETKSVDLIEIQVFIENTICNQF